MRDDYMHTRPLPEGEGAQRAGEGNTAANAKFCFYLPNTPHPPLRGTFSFGVLVGKHLREKAEYGKSVL